jgi:hypothetical protein
LNGNPYYYPTENGLTLIDTVDIAGAYEFDMVAAWQRKEDGAILYAFDSGCSCPTPFEYVDLRPIHDFAAFASEVRKWAREQTYRDVNPDVIEAFIRKVKNFA